MSFSMDQLLLPPLLPMMPHPRGMGPCSPSVERHHPESYCAALPLPASCQTSDWEPLLVLAVVEAAPTHGLRGAVTTRRAHQRQWEARPHQRYWDYSRSLLCPFRCSSYAGCWCCCGFEGGLSWNNFGRTAAPTSSRRIGSTAMRCHAGDSRLGRGCRLRARLTPHHIFLVGPRCPQHTHTPHRHTMLPTPICSLSLRARAKQTVWRESALLDKVVRRQAILETREKQVVMPFKYAKAAGLASVVPRADTSAATSPAATAGPSKTPASPPQRKPTHGQSHVFRPEQNPTTQRWRPARYSARRTMKIVQLALEHNRLDEIPDCPQKSEILAKIQRARDATTPTYQLTSEQAKVGKAEQRSAEQKEILDQLATVKGPYVGRGVRRPGMARFFKGTVGERTRSKKDAKIKDNLSGMDAMVKEWRKANAQDRQKARPSQPF